MGFETNSVLDYAALDAILDTEAKEYKDSAYGPGEKEARSKQYHQVKAAFLEFFQDDSLTAEERSSVVSELLSWADRSAQPNIQDILNLFNKIVHFPDDSPTRIIKLTGIYDEQQEESKYEQYLENIPQGLRECTEHSPARLGQLTTLFDRYHIIGGVLAIYDVIDEIRDENARFPYTLFSAALRNMQEKYPTVYGKPGKTYGEQTPKVLKKSSFWEMQNLLSSSKILERIQLSGRPLDDIQVLSIPPAGACFSAVIGYLFQRDAQLLEEHGTLPAEFPYDIIITTGPSVAVFFYILFREAHLRNPKKVPFTKASLFQRLPQQTLDLDIDAEILKMGEAVGNEGGFKALMRLISHGPKLVRHTKVVYEALKNACQQLIDIANAGTPDLKLHMPAFDDIKFPDLPMKNMVIMTHRKEKKGDFQEVIFPGDQNEPIITEAIRLSSIPPASKVEKGIAGLIIRRGDGDPSVINTEKYGSTWGAGPHYSKTPNPDVAPGEHGPGIFNARRATSLMGHPATYDADDMLYRYRLRDTLEIKNPLFKARLKEIDYRTGWDLPNTIARFLVGYHGEISLITARDIFEDLSPENGVDQETRESILKIVAEYLLASNNLVITDPKNISAELQILNVYDTVDPVLKKILTLSILLANKKYARYFSPKHKSQLLSLFEATSKGSVEKRLLDTFYAPSEYSPEEATKHRVQLLKDRFKSLEEKHSYAEKIRAIELERAISLTLDEKVDAVVQLVKFDKNAAGYTGYWFFKLYRAKNGEKLTTEEIDTVSKRVKNRNPEDLREYALYILSGDIFNFFDLNIDELRTVNRLYTKKTGSLSGTFEYIADKSYDPETEEFDTEVKKIFLASITGDPLEAADNLNRLLIVSPGLYKRLIQQPGIQKNIYEIVRPDDLIYPSKELQTGFSSPFEVKPLFFLLTPEQQYTVLTIFVGNYSYLYKNSRENCFGVLRTLETMNISYAQVTELGRQVLTHIADNKVRTEFEAALEPYLEVQS